MGLSFDAILTGGGWREVDAEPSVSSGPWLRVQVHNSDIAWITFAPSSSGVGQAYVFQTARAYFGDESIPSTNADNDAAELADWLRRFWPSCQQVANLDAVVRKFVIDDDQDIDDHPTPFAEHALEGLLNAVRLPLPPYMR